METRDSTRYGIQTLAGLNMQTGGIQTLAGVPMRLLMHEGLIVPTVEVWAGVEAFENYQTSLGNKFNRTFNLSVEESAGVREAYAALFDPMEATAFDWLGVDAENYALEMLDINLTNLQVRARAVHNDTGKTVERRTRSLEEFEAIKTAYPELVMNYFYFVWGFAKANDARFALFE